MTTSIHPTDFAAFRPASDLLRLWRRAGSAWRDAHVAGPSTVHDIGCDRILRVAKPSGIVVECLHGCVWITIDSDRRDVVLAAGQSFTADRDDRALIQALQSARVRLSPAGRAVQRAR